MVHALAAAFALEAYAGGSPDWGSVAVVVHDSMMTDAALKAVHDYSGGASTFVPCTLARKKSLRKLLQSHQHLRPVALLVLLRLARGRLPPLLLTLVLLLLLEKGRWRHCAVPPSVSPSKHLNLDDLDLKVDKKTLQKFKSAKSAGPVKWKLSFHLSVIVKTSGRAKVVGTDLHSH